MKFVFYPSKLYYRQIWQTLLCSWQLFSEHLDLRFTHFVFYSHSLPSVPRRFYFPHQWKYMLLCMHLMFPGRGSWGQQCQSNLIFFGFALLSLQFDWITWLQYNHSKSKSPFWSITFATKLFRKRTQFVLFQLRIHNLQLLYTHTRVKCEWVAYACLAC